MNLNKLNRSIWLRSLAIMLVLAISGAPAVAQGPGWTSVSTVVNIVNTANGGINVSLSPALVDCVSQSGYGPAYASIYPDHPGISRIKADLLLAWQTGAKIQLYLTDNTCRVWETILSH